MNQLIVYQNTGDLVDDVCHIIDDSQKLAFRSVNASLVLRNWFLGKRITEEELCGANRAEYGSHTISNIAEMLTGKYGKGFNKRVLYKYQRFYKYFPEIVLSVTTQSSGDVIVPLATTQLLSWTHYEKLLQVEDKETRDWYAKEAYEQTWSVRTLQRNISSQYYQRLLKSQDKSGVESEMKQLTSQYQNKLEFIKNPVIAEFLGMQENTSYYESDLEQCIIDNLQKFLMELGKGYAFVARQQRIHTEKEDYYIDLVFYNYILKCFVLIDLKTERISHQDVGQMDMYIRMYDDLKKAPDDNPTLGIVLCADTDEDIAKYSVLHGNEQLFASKYKLFLPTEEELRAEIETQKEFYYLQKKESEDHYEVPDTDINSAVNPDLVVDAMFLDTSFLVNDEIQLCLQKTVDGNAEKGWLPAYHFAICDKQGHEMGTCDLRIGHNLNTYYGGNIGYRIQEEYRGHHYAGKACLLLFELAKKHNMDYLIITCNPDNYPSRKTCEYVGCHLVEIVELPEDNNMRVEEGETEKCIYRIEMK